MAKRTDQASSLSLRQTLFVDEYISNGGNGTAAFVAAFENKNRNTAGVESFKLLRSTKILDAIERRKAALAYANSFSKDEYFRIMVAQARHNPGLIKEKIRADIPLTREEKSALDCKAADRKAALDEIWEKLGLGEGVGKSNWFDGLDQINELIRGTEKEK